MNGKGKYRMPCIVILALSVSVCCLVKELFYNI